MILQSHKKKYHASHILPDMVTVTVTGSIIEDLRIMILYNIYNTC